MIALYSGHMRPHLDYVQLNNQQYKKDIGKLGEGQWRATKMARELQDMMCRKRPRDLSLFSLEKRRFGGYLKSSTI